MKKKKSKLSKTQKKQRVAHFFEFLIISLLIAIGVFKDKLFLLADTYFDYQNQDLMDIINRTIGKFFDIVSIIENNYLKILETITILIFIWIINKLLAFMFHIFSGKFKNATMTILMKSFIKYTINFIAIIFILSAWGLETSTILASIGILGLALSFGAQGLIQDIISGLFIIIEKRFAVGDIIIIDGFRGVVTEIGMRTTKFLDVFNYDLKTINNSDIRTSINASVNLSVSFADISIEYKEDIKKIEELLKTFFPEVNKKYKEIKEGPFYLGVQSLADSSVVIRISAKVEEKDRVQMNRMLNRELKIFFDENNINIPFPQLVVHKS